MIGQDIGETLSNTSDLLFDTRTNVHTIFTTADDKIEQIIRCTVVTETNVCPRFFQPNSKGDIGMVSQPALYL